MAYAPSACYAGPAACAFSLQIGGRGGLRCRAAQEFRGRGGGATHEGHMQSYGSQTDVGVAAGLKFYRYIVDAISKQTEPVRGGTCV